MRASPPLAVVYATLAEAQPLLALLHAQTLADRPYAAYTAGTRGGRVVIAITGMGLAAADAGVLALLAHERPHGVLNAGIAGALHGRLGVGAVRRVAGVAETDDEVVAGEDFHALDPGLFNWLSIAAAPVRLLSRREPLFDTALRDRLAGTADLVDMEGARVAARCADAGVPCALLKAVSDHATDRATLLRNLEHGSRRLAEHLAPPLARALNPTVCHGASS